MTMVRMPRAGLAVLLGITMTAPAAGTAWASPLGEPPGANGSAVADTPPATAAEDAAVADEPETTPEETGKLVYTVSRTPELVFDTPRAVLVIDADQIRRRNARTLPELLMEEAGVFVQQTNYGGGSPIIRGLVGKQILILVDGIRLNTATYRFGPIQYLNTIDVNMIDRIEIVRGVVSVLGSDSAGGAINIVMKKGPAPGDERLGGTAFTRLSSADDGFTGHAQAFGRGARYRFFAGGSYRTSGNVKAGGEIGEQQATGYDEVAANGSFEFFLGADKTLSVGYQYLDQTRVPRTDRVLDGTNLVFDFEPQRRHLLSATYEDNAHGLRLTGYWNRQDEGRQEVRRSAPTTERRLWDRGDVFGATFDMSSFVGSHQLLYGVDFASETIESTRTDLNLLTGQERVRRGNYTDGASYQTFAVYLRDRFNLGERLSVTLGGRYGRFTADGSESSSIGDLDLASAQDAFTGTANLVWHVTPQLNLIGSAIRGFRAANLDDISVYDERSDGTEIPNPDVEPEQIWSYEIGAKFSNRSLDAAAFYFRSDLSELLLRGPGTYLGLPFFDRNGNGIKDPGEPNVLQKQNVGESRIDGFEAEVEWRPRGAVSLFGNVAHTTGDDLTSGDPLPRVPPTFGALGIRWNGKASRHPWAEAVYLFAAGQTRLNPSDVSDNRIGPDGTPAFNIVNLRGGISFGALHLTLAVENVFDEAYKYHGSGVYRPGRQLVLGAQYGF